MSTANLPVLLRSDDLCQRYQISRQTLWRWWTRRKFPAPMRLPGKHPAWLQDDVEAWERSRASTRSKR